MSRTDDKYLKQLQARYRKASKKERTAILDEFVKTTSYHRKHATARAQWTTRSRGRPDPAA